MTCGIYEIVHVASGKRYVGSAVNFASRWRIHRHHLKTGRHHSRYLQRAWDKYGEDAFEFRVLMTCDKHYLIFNEQLEIDKSCEYNMSMTAGSCLGMKMSDSSKLKMAVIKSKLTSDQVLEIRGRCDAGETRKSVSECMGLNKIQVQKVANRETYLFIPEAYQKPSSQDIRDNNISNRGRPPKSKNILYLESAIGQNFTGTQSEILELYPDLNQGKISELFNGKRKSHKGWTLKKAP